MIEDVLLEYDQYFFIHPNFELQWFKDERSAFVLSIDIAEGKGGDYTIINFFQVLPMTPLEIEGVKIFNDEESFFKLVQVAMFRSNMVETPECANWLYHFINGYMMQDNLKIVIENNFEGNYFRNTLMNIYGEQNELDEDVIFCKFLYNARDDNARTFRVGIYQTEPRKQHSCKIFSDQLKNNQLVLTEFMTIQEAMTFARSEKSSSYRASSGHDDCVMTCVNVVNIRDIEEWSELVEIVSENCTNEFWKLVDKKLGKQAERNDELDISDYYD